MPKGKKKETLLITEIPGENAAEIHVYGEYLTNAVFMRVVNAMTENRESEAPKSVRFVVYSSMMHTAVRYAIPSELYDSIEIRSLKPEEGGLKDASGM